MDRCWVTLARRSQTGSGMPDKRLHGAGRATRGRTAGPNASVGESALPRLGEADDGEAAQTDVVSLAVDDDSLTPALGAAGLDAQIGRAAAAVHARLGERFRLRACQASGVALTSVPTCKSGIQRNRTARRSVRTRKSPAEAGL